MQDDYSAIHTVADGHSPPRRDKDTLHQGPLFPLIPRQLTLPQTQDVSIFVEEKLFVLSISPYYLRSPDYPTMADVRLTLPRDVMEDDDSSAKYDISSGILSIALTKVNKGEHFPDLDLTNRLLARTGEVVDTTDSATRKGPPRIQVMQLTDPLDEEDLEAALKYDFEVPQVPTEEEALTGGKYGFNSQYSGHFRYLQNLDLVTLLPEEIEGLTVSRRWTLARTKEDEKFDREWYLADLLEPPEDLIEAMKFQVPDMQQPFTAEEQDALRNLGTKDCISPFGRH